MAAQAPGNIFLQLYPESGEGLFSPSLPPLDQQGKPLPGAPAQSPLMSHWPEMSRVPTPKPTLSRRNKKTWFV